MLLKTIKHQIQFEVDDEDVERVSQYTWHQTSAGYIRRSFVGGTEFLHEFLMGKAPIGFLWDHKNRNKLDNHKSNIELVTPSSSSRNRNIQSHNTSGCSGVKWVERGYRVRIGVNGIQIHLGYYKTFDEAVQIRKSAEVRYWGRNY